MASHPNPLSFESVIGILGGALACAIAAFELAGAPGLTVPYALIAIAAMIALLLIYRLPLDWRCRITLSLFALLVSGGAIWLIVNLFSAHITVRGIDGSRYGSMGEQLQLRIEAKNTGKATSLVHWKATLVTADGRTFTSEPLALSDDIISRGREGTEIKYAYPDCDLVIETTRALQQGDTVSGFISFLFRGYQMEPRFAEGTIELTAEDLDGRTISSGQISIDDANHLPREVFACRQVKSQNITPQR